MAKARLLQKSIILSRKLNVVSEGAENLYYRLLVIADDFGRYHADPKIIKGQLYTLRNIPPASIKKRIDELSKIKLVSLYKTNSEIYLQINQFEKNQSFRADIKRKEEFPTFQQGSRIESVQVETNVNIDTSPVNRNRNRNNNEDKEKDMDKEDDLTMQEIIFIVEYLNGSIGSAFRPSSNNTQKIIGLRWDEGFRLADFQRVIDNKVDDWKHKPDMVKYLRPETLFGNKFESYWNEQKAKPVEDSAMDDWEKDREKGEG